MVRLRNNTGMVDLCHSLRCGFGLSARPTLNAFIAINIWAHIRVDLSMASRNPGPHIQRMPLGFQSYSPRVLRDQQRRRAFFDSEVNTRIYKAIYESFGVKGKINFNKKIGETKINLRCIHGGATNGVNRYTNMSRFGMLQAQQEGWLFKYGYIPDRFH